MPMLLMFPVLMFAATMTAMGHVVQQTFPAPAPAPVDPATTRRRALKVIKGGQQVVLDGAEGAHYRHRQEP
jgi:hypothetical protein